MSLYLSLYYIRCLLESLIPKTISLSLLLARISPGYSARFHRSSSIRELRRLFKGYLHFFFGRTIYQIFTLPAVSSRFPFTSKQSNRTRRDRSRQREKIKRVNKSERYRRCLIGEERLSYKKKKKRKKTKETRTKEKRYETGGILPRFLFFENDSSSPIGDVPRCLVVVSR